MSHNITIARGTDGDWAGLYLNGRLVVEGHDLRVEDVLRSLLIDHEVVQVSSAWLRDAQGGRLPDRPENLRQPTGEEGDER